MLCPFQQNIIDPPTKGVGRKISRRGGQWKKDQKIAKKTEK